MGFCCSLVGTFGVVRCVGTVNRAVNEAGETEDVAPEPRDVAQDSVEPSEVWIKEFHDKTHIHHREQCADAHDIAHPSAEEHISESYSDDNKRRIDDDLHLGERKACNPRECYGNTLAGHCDGVAADFKRYAETKDCAACNLRKKLREESVADKNVGECHVEVEQCSEEESYYELKKLWQLEPAPKHEDLKADENGVHQVGVLADGQRGCHAVLAGEGEDKGNGGNDAAAEIGPHAESHAECHDEK